MLHSMLMTVRIHEQRRMKESVDELFREYDNVDLIISELGPLGFFVRAEKPTLIVMENPSLELYIQIDLMPNKELKGHEILTFEEIEEAVR